MSRAMVAEALVAKVMETRDIMSAQRAGVRTEWFPENVAPVWAWLAKYYGEHDVVPTSAVFRRQWGAFKLPDVSEEPLQAILQEFATTRRAMVCIEALQEAREAVSELEDDTEKSTAVLKIFSRAIDTVAHEGGVSEIEYWHDGVTASVARALYGPRKEELGLSTGFPGLDSVLHGLQPEQFIVIGARDKSFKSTVLLKIAMNIALDGHSVVFVSYEMSAREKWDRTTSLGAGVSHTRVEMSALLDDERQRVAEWEVRVIDLPDCFGLSAKQPARTVSGIAAMIEASRAEAVFIDGLYLMEDDLGEGSGEPLALRHISQGLKRTAQKYKIPIVGTTQASPAKMTRKGGVTVDSLHGTTAWGQDADAVFGIDRNEEVETEATLKVLSSRRSARTDIRIVCDYTRGTMQEHSLADLYRGRKTDDADEDEI